MRRAPPRAERALPSSRLPLAALTLALAAASSVVALGGTRPATRGSRVADASKALANHGSATRRQPRIHCAPVRLSAAGRQRAVSCGLSRAGQIGRTLRALRVRRCERRSGQQGRRIDRGGCASICASARAQRRQVRRRCCCCHRVHPERLSAGTGSRCDGHALLRELRAADALGRGQPKALAALCLVPLLLHHYILLIALLLRCQEVIHRGRVVS